MTRGLRLLAGVLLSAVFLTGCDFDVYELPLPGGADTGDDPIQVHVEFVDVLDLVPKSTVKANDVTVGMVKDIKLDGQIADVTLELRKDTELPANALAEIRQTSLLGEKFVSLKAPLTGASSEPLADGDLIPLERSGRNPEVEEVLGALSLVLNGGGVAQLKTIAAELNKALEGREDSARSVLSQIRIFVRTLDQNKVDIVNAIESLNRLARTAKRQQPTINAALEELPSALVSIDKQRQDLVKMLQALNDLGDVGVRVIEASKDSTIETFRLLQPTLTELANSGDAFVDAFNVFLTYPFVDEVVGRDPQVARNLHMGDYTNLSVELDLDFSDQGGPDVPGIPEVACIPFKDLADILDLPPLEELCDNARKRVTACLNDLKDGDVDIKECERLINGAVEDVIDTLCATPIPGLPADLCDGDGGGGGRRRRQPPPAPPAGARGDRWWDRQRPRRSGPRGHRYIRCRNRRHDG